ALDRALLQRRAGGKRAGVHLHKPHWMCEVDKDGNPVPVSACAPGDYEGKPVVADPGVQHIVDEAIAKASERRKEKLGVTVTQTIRRAWAVESAEGNLFCDLMLAAPPDAQVSTTNRGRPRRAIH